MALITSQTKNPFHFQEASINFLKREALGPDDDENHQKVQVRCFSSFEQAQKTFSFCENGFEFVALEGKLLKVINKIAADLQGGIWYQNDFLEETAKAMAVWGKGKIDPFDHVIPLGVYYRDSKADSNDYDAPRILKPLHLAHADLSKEKLLPISAQNPWKERIEHLLRRPFSEEEFSQMQVVKIINVWFSLNIKPSSNTLALLDQETANKDDFIGVIYDGKEIIRICHNPDQRWNTCLDMSIGKGIVFSSTDTGHTAADFELPANLYRNNLKNRDCGKEAPQNCDSERATIAQGQGASENRNFEVKPTQPNPDSSGCFGIVGQAYRKSAEMRLLFIKLS